MSTSIPDVEKAISAPALQQDNPGNNNDDDDARSISTTTSHPQSVNHDEITRIPTQTSQSHRKSIGGGIAKVITARSNVSVIDPGPPPDGGIKAWTQSFMGHFVVLNTWGMIASFGVFQQYYSSDLGMEPSAVSWIGSMQMLGHFSLGMVSGRAFDAGYFYWCLIPGMVLASLGLFMTSLCTQYWQLFLAQGLMIGVGCGLQFPPVLSLVSTYFSRNRSVALAIMASGAATGGLVYPTIARQLLPKIGFEWTVRVMAFMMLGLGCCYCALLRPRLPPRKSGPLLELSAFSEPPYAVFLIGVFLLCLGQYFATYYIGAYAQDVIGMDYGSSVNVLMVLNGIGVPGRLIPSYFADKFCGPYNTLIPACFICSLILFLWPLVTNEPGIYGWSIAYGFFVGCYQGLFPSALTSLTKDMSKVGTRNGMGFAIVGLGTLIGPPIAGALIQRGRGSYFHAQMYGGISVLLGSLVLVYGRSRITGWKVMARA